jgi:hypothetical protein
MPCPALVLIPPLPCLSLPLPSVHLHIHSIEELSIPLLPPAQVVLEFPGRQGAEGLHLLAKVLLNNSPDKWEEGRGGKEGKRRESGHIAQWSGRTQLYT